MLLQSFNDCKLMIGLSLYLLHALIVELYYKKQTQSILISSCRTREMHYRRE